MTMTRFNAPTAAISLFIILVVLALLLLPSAAFAESDDGSTDTSTSSSQSSSTDSSGSSSTNSGSTSSTSSNSSAESSGSDSGNVGTSSSDSSSDSDAGLANTNTGADSQHLSDTGQSSTGSSEFETVEATETEEKENAEQRVADNPAINDAEITADAEQPAGSSKDNTASDESETKPDGYESSSVNTSSGSDNNLSEEDKAGAVNGEATEIVDDKGNSYVATITPDGLVDEVDTGNSHAFTVTFTEVGTDSIGSAQVVIPDQFTLDVDSPSVVASNGGSWSWVVELANKINFWADNEDAFISSGETVEVSFEAEAPADGERGAYAFETKAWTAVTDDFNAAGTNNMAAGYSDPVAVVGKEVNTAEDLNNVRNNLDDHYVQTADIDLSGYSNWQPIGDYTNGFTGTYHGGGHDIDGLRIIRRGTDPIGLFGVAGDGALITSLSLNDVYVTGGTPVGALVGRLSNGEANNISASGSVSAQFMWGSELRYHNTAGGLVGIIIDGSITNSNADVTVSGNRYLGGLVGRTANAAIADSYAKGDVTVLGTAVGSLQIGGLVGGGDNSVINRCYAEGNVHAPNSRHVGGLVGDILGNSIVTNSYATGSVNGLARTGGLIGYNRAAVLNSFAIGTVHADGVTVGGLIGEMSGTGTDNVNATVIYSYYDSDTTGQSDIGKGIPLTTNEMLTGYPSKEIYRFWSNSIWNFSDPSSYPSLQRDPNPESYPAMVIKTFSNGDGTASDPYLVATAADLNLVRYYPDAHFKQINTINLESEVWEPIGNYFYPFNGNYDGNNQVIEGLSFSKPFVNHVGLFGYTGSGTQIHDLHLTDVEIKGLIGVGAITGINHGDMYNNTVTGQVSGFRYVGGLAGYSAGGEIVDGKAYVNINGKGFLGGIAGLFENGNVTGCEYKGIIDGRIGTEQLSVYGSSFSLDSIGGLLGYLDNGSVVDCHVSAEIGSNNSMQRVGGLIGSSDNGRIYSCSAAANITGSINTAGGLIGSSRYDEIKSSSFSGKLISDGSTCGGLIGFNRFTMITDSYATGEISGNRRIGGLIGRARDSVLSASYASVKVNGNNHVGGLVGHNQDSTIEYSYASGDVKGDQRVGGLVGENEDGVIINSYAAGNVTATGDLNGPQFVGGLVGNNIIEINGNGESHPITITGCYFSTDSNLGIWGVGNDDTHSGVTGLTTKQMRSIASYVEWNIETSTQFILKDGETYLFPFLFWERGSVNPPVWYIYGDAPKPITDRLSNGFSNIYFHSVPAPVRSQSSALTNIPGQAANAPVTPAFVTGGSAADLGRAVATYNQAKQSFEANKGNMSVIEIVVTETELAIANASIIALDLSLADKSGQAVDLAALIAAYNAARAVLNSNRDLLSAEQIAEAEALLEAIALMINRLSS